MFRMAFDMFFSSYSMSITHTLPHTRIVLLPIAAHHSKRNDIFYCVAHMWQTRFLVSSSDYLRMSYELKGGLECLECHSYHFSSAKYFPLGVTPMLKCVTHSIALFAVVPYSFLRSISFSCSTSTPHFSLNNNNKWSPYLLFRVLTVMRWWVMTAKAQKSTNKTNKFKFVTRERSIYY